MTLYFYMCLYVFKPYFFSSFCSASYAYLYCYFCLPRPYGVLPKAPKALPERSTPSRKGTAAPRRGRASLLHTFESRVERSFVPERGHCSAAYFDSSKEPYPFAEGYRRTEEVSKRRYKKQY